MMKGQPVGRLAILMLGAALTIGWLSGCSRASRSTGFLTTDEERTVLPGQIPVKVAVAPFNGDPRIAARAAEQFSMGLFRLGFDIAGQDCLLALSQQEGLELQENLNAETCKLLREKLDLQGLFLGTVTSHPGRSRVITHVVVKLVRTGDGRTIWVGEARDPRRFTRNMNPDSSIEYAVDRILKVLEKDLRRAGKRT